MVRDRMRGVNSNSGDCPLFGGEGDEASLAAVVEVGVDLEVEELALAAAAAALFFFNCSALTFLMLVGRPTFLSSCWGAARESRFRFLVGGWVGAFSICSPFAVVMVNIHCIIMK